MADIHTDYHQLLHAVSYIAKILWTSPVIITIYDHMACSTAICSNIFLSFINFFFGWGLRVNHMGYTRIGQTRSRQLTGAEQKGLGWQMASGSQLISSEERPETPGLKGRRADKQVGRQTDRRTNALIGRHPESRQTRRQMYRQRLDWTAL